MWRNEHRTFIAHLCTAGDQPMVVNIRVRVGYARKAHTFLYNGTKTEIVTLAAGGLLLANSKTFKVALWCVVRGIVSKMRTNQQPKGQLV
jgi:hypothetical protein